MTISTETIAEINRCVAIVHANAKAHGFHDDTESEFIAKTTANIHGEVSEFWEAYRKGQLHQPCDKLCGLTCAEEELADIAIRVFDTAKRLGIDIGKAIAEKHEYNLSRPYRHGNKAA